MQLLFYKRGKTFLERLICFWTCGPYYHVAMLFGTDLIEAIDTAGVHVIGDAKLNPANFDILIIDMTPEQIDNVRSFLSGELGCGYDWVGLFLTQVLCIHRAS